MSWENLKFLNFGKSEILEFFQLENVIQLFVINVHCATFPPHDIFIGRCSSVSGGSEFFSSPGGADIDATCRVVFHPSPDVAVHKQLHLLLNVPCDN